MSQIFTSGGQSIRASASTSVLPMNIEGWFPFGLTGLNSLQSKGLSGVFSNTTIQNLDQFFSAQLSLWFNSHIHTWTTGKTIALIIWTFVGKVMSLLFNMLSKFIIAFLPKSKCLLISWLQLPSAVILEPKKKKSVTVPIVSPSICPEVMGLDAMILFSECWVLSQLFHSPLSLSSRVSVGSQWLTCAYKTFCDQKTESFSYHASVVVSFF